MVVPSYLQLDLQIADTRSVSQAENSKQARYVGFEGRTTDGGTETNLFGSGARRAQRVVLTTHCCPRLTRGPTQISEDDTRFNRAPHSGDGRRI